MAITVTHHMEPVAESGAASVVVTCQRVVELCRIHRRKWSRIVAITAACRMEPVAGSGGAVQNLSQEVEQSRGHYCGLSGSPGQSAEAQLKHLAERGSYPSERSSDVAGEPSNVGCCWALTLQVRVICCRSSVGGLSAGKARSYTGFDGGSTSQ